MEFLVTNALLLQHVIETAIITWRKWLNESFRTQRPHRTMLIQLCNQLINQFWGCCCTCWLRNSLNIPKPSKADQRNSFLSTFAMGWECFTLFREIQVLRHEIHDPTVKLNKKIQDIADSDNCKGIRMSLSYIPMFRL